MLSCFASALALLAASLFVTAARAADAVDDSLAPGLSKDPPAGGSVEKLTVPFLHAPEVERLWGAPVLTVVADGSYVLVYRNAKAADGSEYFKIVGTRREVPIILDNHGRPAVFGATFLFGQRIKFFILDYEKAPWRSTGLELTAPDGRRANYVLFLARQPSWPDAIFPPVEWASPKAK